MLKTHIAQTFCTSWLCTRKKTPVQMLAGMRGKALTFYSSRLLFPC